MSLCKLSSAIEDRVRTGKYGMPIQRTANVVGKLFDGTIAARRIFPQRHQQNVVEITAQRPLAKRFPAGVRLGDLSVDLAALTDAVPTDERRNSL